MKYKDVLINLAILLVALFIFCFSWSPFSVKPKSIKSETDWRSLANLCEEASTETMRDLDTCMTKLKECHEDLSDE